jgi:hypothetical protein
MKKLAKRERIVEYTRRVVEDVWPKLESKKASEADHAIHHLHMLVSRLAEELES